MNDKKQYLKEDVHIIQYPNGNELCFIQGEIHSIINYKIKFSYLILNINNFKKIWNSLTKRKKYRF
jgi:hypothetical protein